MVFWVFAIGDYEFLEPVRSNINVTGVGVGLLVSYNKSTGRGERARTLLEQMVWSGRNLHVFQQNRAAQKTRFLRISVMICASYWFL